jgi:hypothetical protein
LSDGRDHVTTLTEHSFFSASNDFFGNAPPPFVLLMTCITPTTAVVDAVMWIINDSRHSSTAQQHSQHSSRAAEQHSSTARPSVTAATARNRYSYRLDDTSLFKDEN